MSSSPGPWSEKIVKKMMKKLFDNFDACYLYY